MKRKFLSVMLAACAAVFSFSGLTGCSGGGNDEENYGVVTLEDFKGLSKGFSIALGTVMEIVPTGDANLEHQNDDIVIMYCDLNVGGDKPIKAQVTYHLDWPDDQEYPTPGKVTAQDASETPDAFSGTYLIISLMDGDDATDTNLMKAMGEPKSKTETGGSINIAVNFAAGRCSMETQLYKYNKDGEPGDYDVAHTGPCYAKKL